MIFNHLNLNFNLKLVFDKLLKVFRMSFFEPIFSFFVFLSFPELTRGQFLSYFEPQYHLLHLMSCSLWKDYFEPSSKYLIDLLQQYLWECIWRINRCGLWCWFCVHSFIISSNLRLRTLLEVLAQMINCNLIEFIPPVIYKILKVQSLQHSDLF